MGVGLVRTLRMLTQVALDNDGPRRLALGVMLGMMLGLVPKGNLTALTLAVLIFTLRVHLGAALLSAVGFSWFGKVCDPICHAVGERLLTWRVLEPTWTWLADLPIVPWTAFNNTVVLGSLVLAVYLMVPVYLTSLMLFEGCQPWLREQTKRFRIAPTLATAEAVIRVRAQ